MAKNTEGKMSPELRKVYKKAIQDHMKELGISTHDAKNMEFKDFKNKTGFNHSYNYLARGFTNKGVDPSNEAIEHTCLCLGIQYTPIEIKPYDIK